MNALGHLLNFRKRFSNSVAENVSVFHKSESYLQRVIRFLSKKMKIREDNETLFPIRKQHQNYNCTVKYIYHIFYH